MDDSINESKSLDVQSRSVRCDKLDSPPLPESPKEECFEGVADEPVRTSEIPCDRGCCTFPEEGEDRKICKGFQMRDWSELAKSTCSAHLAYDSTMGLATSAEWLKLPDRDELLEHYRANPKRERRLACLNTLRFDPTTGLGEVHEWIRSFLQYEGEHGFYLVSVMVGAIKSFLEAVEGLDVVVLPYGCVTDGGTSYTDDEQTCLEKHRRRFILAVNDDDDYVYRLALPRVRPGFEKPGSQVGRVVTSVYINSASHLINAIAYVSRVKFTFKYLESHYVVFNPVVWHAIWWMYLLVPGGHLDRYARFRICKDAETERKRAHASTELGIENCVVRFDPLHLVVGDPVQDTMEHVLQNRPFVFWFGGIALNVEETRDAPPLVLDSKRRFVEWCALTQTNTLLNLNGNSWVDLSDDRRYDSLYEINSVWDGEKRHDFEDELSQDESEFNMHEGHVFDEGYTIAEYFGTDDDSNEESNDSNEESNDSSYDDSNKNSNDSSYDDSNKNSNEDEIVCKNETA